jgi:hypothetical protein
MEMNKLEEEINAEHNRTLTAVPRGRFKQE